MKSFLSVKKGDIEVSIQSEDVYDFVDGEA